MIEEAYIFLPSFAQQRLWFIDQLMPGTPAYNLPTAMHLAGPLDAAALARSLRAIMQRHETTRTTFTTVDGALVQVVAPAATEAPNAPSLPLLDLTALPEATRAGAMRTLASAEARRPFDLARGPLLRAGLLRLGPDEHVLLVTMHHIVSDGWSMGVLVRELVALYAAYTGGVPAALPELPIQYSDYAHWQREWLQGEGDHAGSPLQAQLAYWKAQLAGAPATLELPSDRPRSSLQSFEGTRRSWAIAWPLLDSLKRLSQQAGTTLFMTLLATFDCLLARYSGQHDIVVGTPIANRTQGETEGLIGCFVNTLVLRTDLSGNPTFRELARRVRETALAAYAHQDVPFELVVDALRPARELSYNPLFQIMFALQNMPPINLDVPGLQLRPLDLGRATAMFDLSLAIEETRTGLRGTLEYATELFEQTTITRLLGHFTTLLAGIAADPTQRLADLPLLTAAERQQLLIDWNATGAGVGGATAEASCLHELFEAQAARTPDAIALIFDASAFSLQPSATQRVPGLQLTYRELARRANQLAQHLRCLGVGPQVLVSLCVERSLELVIGLLGILKAGGAFLPLDPAYPLTRLNFMLDDSRAAVLITATDHGRTETRRQGDKETAQLLVSLSPDLLVSRAVVDLSRDWPLIARSPTTPPASAVGVADLAYMIYTSGSTGVPKGVPIRHGSAVPFFLWYQEYFGLRADDRVIQYHSLSFDFSTWEIFEALIVGAALYVVPASVAQDVGALADTLADARISVLNMTPSQFSALCDYVEQFKPSALATTRILVLGGELFPTALARRAAQIIPAGCQLYNEYGPTETTISSAIFRVTAAALTRSAELPGVPIGPPIGNTQFYLLDARLQPVPIGVPGDLYIGGVGLAREYFGRPALTAARFIPNPFLKDEGGRMRDEESQFILHPSSFRLYKTGDRVRYRADGTIDFLGRQDEQVKLRGYRIELGEIETTLSQHPAVRECVVLAREDAPGDKRLVAYVVQGSGARDQEAVGADVSIRPPTIHPPTIHPPIPDPRPLIPELRDYLAARLPEYLRPTAFVLLDALPLTPNGKLDRRALPAPDSSRPELAEDFVAPRSAAEETLARVWAALLRLERVGIHDNFFMLGGDSILSIQMIARAGQAGLQLTPRQVFQHQTIAQLAAVAQQSPDVLAEQGMISDVLPLTPIQRGTTPADFPLAQLDQPTLDRLLEDNRGIIDIYPLTPMQQGLLFHTLAAPESGVYVQQVSCLLLGELNHAAFLHAWQSVIARHPVLRSAVVWEQLAEPLQIVSEQVALPFHAHDWQALPAAEQQAQLDALLRADRARGFDLSSAPLMRLTLIQRDATTTYLLWSHHHLLLDGWSVPLVLDEVVRHYLAECAGQVVTLSQLRPYRDYIAWLQRQDLAQAEAFWRETLRDLTAATPLVVDHPADSSVAAQAVAAERQAALAEPTTSALLRLARQHSLTLNTLVQGAWALLLQRYSGANEVVFGSTVAGRPPELPGVEAMVGLFINTLPLRVRLAGGTTTLDWLQQLQDQQVAMREYEYSPLVQIQSWSAIPRGRALFESIVVFENYPVIAGDAAQRAQAGLTIQQVRTIPQTNYPLMLVAMPGPALTLRIIYDSHRFAPDTIERMLGHLETLLVSIAEQPDRRLDELSLLTAAERAQLLETEDGALLPFSHNTGLHDIFAAQASRTPDAVALFFAPAPQQPQHLTYQALNARANQLAHHLQERGVGPEVRVGIVATRSLELVIGLLGILKAGGAYLPLDPSAPPDRHAFMLEDAQAALLITPKDERRTTNNEETQPESLHDLGLRIDDLRVSPAPIQNPKSKIQNPTPANLAYVLYTSGSTGTPKAVLVSHANVCRLFAATQPTYQFSANDIWTLFHSAAFDFSVWEMWGAFAYGGRLVVVPFATSRTPDAYFSLLRDTGVTVLNQTPAAFRQLMTVAVAHADTLALRLVIFGGDALDPAGLRPWVARYGDERPQLVNMYGITETTVHVTKRRLKQADLVQAAGSPIGRALPDLRLYLLDARLRLVPIGVPGELYVGGAGVTRGYLGRAELTAEKFIPNPFAGDKETRRQGAREREDAAEPQSAICNLQSAIGMRLYKTGDLARRLPNGDLEYLGRIDRQVQLRGFRIELGEIEAALARHPAVRTAVVIAREDSPGEQRLVAYIVPTAGEGDKETDGSGTIYRALPIPDPRSLIPELRDQLGQTLPDYMVPSAFVLLDMLPLTVNGKLDRAALPAPDSQRALDTPFALASTPQEEVLAAIWAQVLGHEQVGVDDHFFALGGDSITSIQVISRARARGLSLTLPQLFQHPTIRALSRELATAAPDSAPAVLTQPFELIDDAVRAQLPEGIVDAYPLTMLQSGMLFHSIYTPDSSAYHNISSLHLRAPFDEPALRAALQQLAANHPALRTSFDLTSFGEPLQLVHRAVVVPLQIADLRQLPPAQHEAILAAWFAAEQRRPFDWASPPLLRLQIHRRSDETFQFSWAEHHAILDGWSVASLLTELFQTYMALRSTDASAPAPPRSSFRDFVALERATLASNEARQFWAKYLSDSEITLLPRWPLAPSANQPALRLHDVPIPPDVALGLQRLARTAAVPLKSVLLAAHLRVLALLSGQHDLLTGLIANGRPETTDGERVLGLFLNTLPFRQRLTSGTWVELVQAVFANEYALLPYRRYPLGELQRSNSGRPLIETAFNFVHFHVYQRLQAIGGLDVLDQHSMEQTNLLLMAHFSRSHASEQVQLTLNADGRAIGQAQLALIADSYARVLAIMASAPESRYDAHSLLTEAEQRRQLVEWNNTAVFYPQDLGIHQLFEAQVARTPDAIALVFDRGQGSGVRDQESPAFSLQPPRGYPDFSLQLTYAELNRRANQLAHMLRAHGVGPDVLVGICLARSIDMVVGLLGILKAGGAYVPLDPTYPKERLQFMHADSQARVLITQQGMDDGRWTMDDESSSAHPIVNGPSSIVNLAATWPIIAQFCANDPPSRSAPDNLAYVIYTSGSTGAPKGVAITQRALVNLLHTMRQTPGLNDQDVLLAVTTIAFDIAGLELFLPLLCGARVELVPRAVAMDGHELAARLVSRRATIMQATPATWRMLVDAGWPGSAQLTILCGGEALPRDLAEQLLTRSAALWNMYGPTETTIWSAVARVAAGADVMIGRAIANTQLYLLDRWLNPAPIGVPGELYIGGAGLARGYLNRPDLTAERFIPNPFAGGKETRRQGDKETGDVVATQDSSFVLRPSSFRLYKTGDLARYRADGAIEYLGRRDHQVKLRGYRIELGEIEMVLAQHPAVSTAVVVLRADAPGDARLVAYVVQGSGVRERESGSKDKQTSRQADKENPNAVLSAPQPLTPDPQSLIPELRDFLQQRLPAYMQPALFVVLDALPLTANGKIDRPALPAPDPNQPEPGVAFVAPRTDVEAQLAAIWCQVLGRDQIGVDDDFFALGGDSILSLQIIAYARQAGIHLSTHHVFEQRTIAALAAHAELSTAQAVPQGPIGGVLPLTPSQRWFFAQELPDPQHFNQALLLTTQSLERGLLAQTLRQLLAHHDALRLRFTRGADGWVQSNATVENNTVVSWLDLARLAPADHSRVIEAAAAALQASLDLAHGPLVRVAYIELGTNQPGRLLLIAHHLVIDGASWRVLLDDLQTAYEQLHQGMPVTLPPKTTAFQQWAEQLSAYAQTPALRDELAIWLDRPWSRSARLPVDEQAGANTAVTARTLRVTLDAEATAALLYDLPQAYHTQMSDALLAALAQSFMRWTGAATLLLDLEEHERAELFTELDLSLMIGSCTTIFPVLLELPDEADPAATLTAIKEQLRSIPRHGIGYGLLRYLSQEAAIRDALASLPQAEVRFSYLGQLDQTLLERGLFGPANESVGPLHSPHGRRSHLIEINASIAAGQLELVWTYSAAVHHATTITRLAEDMLAALHALIAHCQSPDVGGFTPSDFPLLGVSQDVLDKIVRQARFEEA